MSYFKLIKTINKINNFLKLLSFNTQVQYSFDDRSVKIAIQIWKQFLRVLLKQSVICRGTAAISWPVHDALKEDNQWIIRRNYVMKPNSLTKWRVSLFVLTVDTQRGLKAQILMYGGGLKGGKWKSIGLGFKEMEIGRGRDNTSG